MCQTHKKAAQIIAATFRSKDIQLADANNLYLYDTALPVTKINRSFMEAGIDVQEAHLCEDTLEDYFKRITGVRGLLKLIQCEMRKLKRKHYVSFVVFAALLFPIPFTALVLAGSVGNFTGFEAVFGLLATMGMPIMLPAVLGIIAAMLFFMERDNDTLKNLRTIPVSPIKIATAKNCFTLHFRSDFCCCYNAFVDGWWAGLLEVS